VTESSFKACRELEEVLVEEALELLDEWGIKWKGWCDECESFFADNFEACLDASIRFAKDRLDSGGSPALKGASAAEGRGGGGGGGVPESERGGASDRSMSSRPALDERRSNNPIAKRCYRQFLFRDRYISQA
jgi:hypothetical protein